MRHRVERVSCMYATARAKLFGFVCISPLRLPASPSRQVVRTAPRLERLSRTRKKLKFVRGTPPQVVSPSLSSHVAGLLPSPLRVASSSRPRRKSNPPLSPDPRSKPRRNIATKNKSTDPPTCALPLSVYLSIYLSFSRPSISPSTVWTDKEKFEARVYFSLWPTASKDETWAWEIFMQNNLFKIKIETDF